jgi:hypothetical protein
MVTRRCGPSGGAAGEEFADDVLLEDWQVAEVRIHAQEQVHAVQIVHVTCDGRRHAYPVHGRTVAEPYILQLKDDEFIVAISGHFSGQVDSIRIHTNKRVSPLLGGADGGGGYAYEAPSGSEIVGFCGRAGDSLSAIGVVLRGRGL